MPFVYIDAVPICGDCTYYMLRSDNGAGPHQAHCWYCANPECKQHRVVQVMPLQRVETLAIGLIDPKPQP